MGEERDPKRDEKACWRPSLWAPPRRPTLVSVYLTKLYARPRRHRPAGSPFLSSHLIQIFCSRVLYEVMD